jgi:hypothetical protein
VRADTWQKKMGYSQGCQMVYFQTKNPSLGIFWRALVRKIFVFYDHLQYFMAIW